MDSAISGTIAPELVELLRCPETHQRLTVAPRELLAWIEKEKLRNRAGAVVEEPVSGGLIREDGTLLYLIRDGIPIMLIDEAVPIPPAPK